MIKFSKTEQGKEDILQNYFRYLPFKKDDDKQLLVDLIKVGWKHHRIALTFNHPEILQPKLVQILPFFDNNFVSLSEKESQICWIKKTVPEFAGQDGTVGVSDGMILPAEQAKA